MPGIIQKASQHFLNLQKLVRQNLRAERLGWFDHKKSPDPLKLPDKARTSFLNGKLKKSPVIIPVLGWPAGTEIGREADWSWRIENVLDQRKESERPSSTRIAPLEESDDMMDNLRKVASRHIAQAKQVNHTRQLLFKSNLGMVTFEMKVLEKKEEEEEKKLLLVHHDLYAVPKEGKPGTLQKQEVYAKHTINLEASEEEKAPTFPKIKAETDG
ncbi:MAG: hypothetical protein HKN31_14775 [Pricia sp.]|nr:hypothetical protein [Pricia sp.]